jgi:NADH-quinone oxidoreductase subunit N
MTPDLASYVTALPEIVLAAGALVLLMVGAFGGERVVPVVSYLAVALIAVVAVLLVAVPPDAVQFSGAFTLDPFARLLKLVVLIGSAIAIVMAYGFARTHKFDRFEYPVLIVIATLGMMLMISASDLIAVYLGLEMQSLALYVVAAINRD